MSRPDQFSGSAADEPRLPRAARTVHRRSAAVPLRVVSHRVRADEPSDRSAHGAPVPTVVAGVPATGAVATLQQAPLPSPDVVGLPVRRAEAAPVLARRRPVTRLLDLVRGRRDGAGRHRPDTIPSRGWSMFAPARRSRRRFGVRR
ncbi:hypothetical protein GCM10023201_43040 [Actinomycetospora corticicola]|uniref:Uncharacterized protein n=1 Tax=Actinomycetospora corticicola TaxID=663602 RepID=A0A7Y9DW51_9PSEU|nr:hypothetical protein [Actinomycetospora corticicola]NYD36605.1 hypothetical protein [Actinomycetospora corticicola]